MVEMELLIIIVCIEEEHVEVMVEQEAVAVQEVALDFNLGVADVLICIIMKELLWLGMVEDGEAVELFV